MRRPTHLLNLTSTDGLDDALANVKHGLLAVDTETTGLDWKTELVGAICLAAGRTAIFAWQGALGPVARWLGDQVVAQRPLVFHNAKFDLHHLRRTFGLHVPYPVHDTRLESFLVDNRGAPLPDGRFPKFPTHGLKPLAAAFVDPDALDPEKEMMAAIRRRAGVGSTKGDWFALKDTEDEHYVTTYGALDPWYTLQLHKQLYSRILHWPTEPNSDSLATLYETERWLLLALRDMEARGIKANRRFLEQWRDSLRDRLDAREAELAELAGGRTINWQSTPQLRTLLYDTLGIEPDRTTDSGEPSTDGVSLLNMSHPIGAALLKYREDFKQWSSYATSLLTAMTPQNTIHATFHQTGAETGRMSCSDPNLQQQTRESGVRRAYRPRKGLVLRFADYSQVEMRYASHFANEPSFIKGFNEDPDFDTHAATARNMYGLETPSSRQRKFGKIINFTKLFGGGEDKITEQLINLMELDEARAGCKELGHRCGPGESPHRSLAQLLITQFNRTMPAMQTAIRGKAKLAEKLGYVSNAYGRHRFLDDRWYRAFNTEVQGSAGDQAKKGLVALYRELQLGTGDIALLLQIHDEAVYESEGDPKVDRRVLELLQDLHRFKVPIIADVSGSATTWQDKKQIEL
jgi:DNA polymerase I-like protein with 3'-5' exonuclease and polymerase domains